MSKKVGMNVFLHFLLVIKQMNNFTVTQAKDALLLEKPVFTDAVETRKFIYRQLTRHIEKGFLKRSSKLDKAGKEVIYSKTDLFFSVTIIPTSREIKAKSNKETSNKHHYSSRQVTDYQTELKKELHAYEIDLNTVFEEAKEYKRLKTRFPELQDQLQQHQSKAKENSIKLLGKIRALNNLLSTEIVDNPLC